MDVYFLFLIIGIYAKSTKCNLFIVQSILLYFIVVLYIRFVEN